MNGRVPCPQTSRASCLRRATPALCRVQRGAVSLTRLAYDESGLPPSDAALQQLHAFKRSEFKSRAQPNPLAHLIAKRPNSAGGPAQGYRQFGVWHVVQIDVGVTTQAMPHTITRQLWPWLSKVEVDEE